MAYLTTYLTSSSPGAPLPVPASKLLESVCPLMLDGSSSVRTQLLKLFQALRKEDIEDHVLKILPYMRAGMTHLSHGIRLTGVEFYFQLIKVWGQELVSVAGGWYQSVQCFATVLGWRSTDPNMLAANTVSFGGDAKSKARTMQVFAELLRVGLVKEHVDEDPNWTARDFPYWHVAAHQIPTKSHAYAYLNLFGPQDIKKSRA